MAPPPEYDKEPKAPDKSATNISCEEMKTLHNLVIDQQTNSDSKSSSTAASAEAENNKLIETLDDGQLRALLDEAITYKCPKDREGKSSLFKELLEEVEQDEQASEAAARGLSGGRAAVTRACAVTSGRGSRSRRVLPHSNSLQDLVAALAAEPAPRRHHRAPPAPAPAPVSARAIHGGSLPSGVDTSFLLGEEPARGAGYLATVRCVNPPPLAERRVSTDANCSSELDSLNRRSKPAFPMTYTARATLEIGSGAVCSGRAVTTTTASNQVRTRRPPHYPRLRPAPIAGPPEKIYKQTLYNPNYHHKRYSKKNIKSSESLKAKDDTLEETDVKDTSEVDVSNKELNDIKEDINEELSISKEKDKYLDYIIEDIVDPNQFKLFSALFPKVSCDKAKHTGGGSESNIIQCDTIINNEDTEKQGEIPRGPEQNIRNKYQQDANKENIKDGNKKTASLPATINENEEINAEVAVPTTSIIQTIPSELTMTKKENNEISTFRPKENNKTELTENTILIEAVNNTTTIPPKIIMSKKEKKKISTGSPKANNKTKLTEDTTSIKEVKNTATITSAKSTISNKKNKIISTDFKVKNETELASGTDIWTKNIKDWYDGLENYSVGNSYHGEPFYQYYEKKTNTHTKHKEYDKSNECYKQYKQDISKNVSSNIFSQNIASSDDIYNWSELSDNATARYPFNIDTNTKEKDEWHVRRGDIGVKSKEKKTVPSIQYEIKDRDDENIRWVLDSHIQPVEVIDRFDESYYYCYDDLDQSRRQYRERIGNLIAPKQDEINPRNVRSMTIGKSLSDFDEFENTISNDYASEQFKISDTNEGKYSLEYNTSTDIANLPNDLLASSFNTMKLKDVLDKKDEEIEDIALNFSVRSSTPIPDESPIKDELSDVASTEKDNEVVPENNSKIEVTSPNEDFEQEKGTVTPVFGPPNPITVDTNEHLCSFSLKEERSIEVHPQKENKYVELLCVNPIENSKVSCNDLNQIDMSLDGPEIKDISADVINNLTKLSYSNKCGDKSKFDKQEKIWGSDTSSDKENDVELIDKSKHSYDVNYVGQDGAEELLKSYDFRDRCEDTSFSKHFELQEKLRKSDTSFDNEVELADMSSNALKYRYKEDNKNLTKLDYSSNICGNTLFSEYFSEQQKLFQALEDSDLVDSSEDYSLVSSVDNSEKVHTSDKDKLFQYIGKDIVKESQEETHGIVPNVTYSEGECPNIYDLAAKFQVLVLKKNSNGPVILTLPFKFFSNDRSIENADPFAIEYNNINDNKVHMQTINNTQLLTQHSTVQQQNNTDSNKNIEKSKLKKKTEKANFEKRKIETANKRALKAIMFENYSKSTVYDQLMSSSLSTVSIKEVDSAIPFSCITTPEVVASCNTTSSTSQSAVTVDPKPLQLASSYRAVSSLVGEPRAPSPAPSPPPPPAARALDQVLLQEERPRGLPLHYLATTHPRSVITSTFNGLPLSRPNYGSTGNTAQDEYKKSIDENGNSVQGFSSPLSGSSQHKKPRRKKSSKNETVIKSHQIDGYQGNKDLNEVLRFIESAADTTRAGKLGRTKHRDDADDKGGKKRSGARKDKESKMKRATSMEEFSCSRMEDLTDKPSPPARAPRHSDQAKAERRSWGDDAREATTRFFREEPSDSTAADTEFQTVTKKRKPRRRADEPPEPAGGDPPRAPRAPEPRARRVSAPPSDRSNDSNDDMDSVHSLPADAGGGAARGAAAPASYADIARTRHNIPDLIESCNFYSEGERDRGGERGGERAAGGEAGVCAAPGDADGYPALEPRARRVAPGKTAPPPARTVRKVERVESLSAGGAGCADVWAAPDVVVSRRPRTHYAADVAAVAERRPAVILLDHAAPRDMDGVTFGFDIDETLLGGPTRRPRCDLIRDALEVAHVPAAESNGAAGVAVRAGCAALRYVPPAPPPDTLHLHQIIDYVGAAWEDVVRCGAGKVRYFSE